MAAPRTDKRGFQPPSGDASHTANRQEDRLIRLIEAKKTIERYGALLERIEKGSMDVTGFFKAVSPDAALMLTDLMHSGESDKVRLEATKEVLDRGGFGKTQKIQVHGQLGVDHDTSKMELINMILSSARRAKLPVKESAEALPEKRVGPTIDVESRSAVPVGLDDTPPEGA